MRRLGRRRIDSGAVAPFRSCDIAQRANLEFHCNTVVFFERRTSDYKEDAPNNEINELQVFLLRGCQAFSARVSRFA
jgi:hypothetical protein